MSIEISIIIPTCNRPMKLKKCIFSVLNQDFPQDKTEIIVVDDRDEEEVKNLLAGLKNEYQNLRYLGQNRKGPAAARNLGVKNALGPVVGFIDDDCEMQDGWLKKMVNLHKANPEIAAIGGDTITSNDKTPALVSQSLSTGSIETYVEGQKDAIFFPTCNVAIKKEIILKHPFNEDFPLPGGEDLEFFWRLYKSGYRFIWDRNLKVIHYRQDSLRSFLRQAYYYGRGNLLVKYIHNDQPLLKELWTGNFSFWASIVINFIKIPRFSYCLGKRLIKEKGVVGIRKKLSIYAFFLLHKIPYLLGNMVEFLRIKRGLVKKRLDFLPELLILDITHSCNLHCKICDIWKTAKQETDIDIACIKKMLLEAKKIGIAEVALSGGEALLREDIFEILDYSRRLKIKNLGILTNGTLVKEKINRIAPYLLDNSVSLVLSLDSLKDSLHNQIRDSSFAWQATQDALKILSEMKKINRRINFNVITIILNQNLEELPSLANFIKETGASSLQFQAYLPNNLEMAKRQSSLFWVEESRLGRLDTAIESLIKMKEENPGFIKNSSSNLSLIKKYFRGILTSGDVKCVSAYKTVLVSNQGTCTTCFGPYGNIKEQGLGDILRSEKLARFQDKVRNCPWPCLLPCFCDRGQKSQLTINPSAFR